MGLVVPRELNVRPTAADHAPNHSFLVPLNPPSIIPWGDVPPPGCPLPSKVQMASEVRRENMDPLYDLHSWS
jgi:hypothetical protein